MTFALLQQQINTSVQQLADTAMADAGLMATDGWKLVQQPDGRWRFERTVPDPSPETP